MAQYRPSRGIAGAVAIIAVALLAAAAVVRHYRKSTATALLERELVMVPAEVMTPAGGMKLFSFPGGMPGNGYSGRATNEEDYADPYGGGDKPGPYGRVNDPYDGDWALNPLGGKQIKMQALPMMNNMGEDNIWNGAVMGTNSIFMHHMSSKDAEAARAAKAMQSKGPSGPGADDTFVGTNQVFFGSNGGGYGWARAPRKPMAGQAEIKRARQSLKNQPVFRDGYSNAGKIQSVPKLGGTNFAFNGADGYHYGWAKKQQTKAHPSSKNSKKGHSAKKSTLQSLFRSGDAHEAEYGREGDNQLNDDVLPSAVGSGGPVIGVDGKPSNVDHTWQKHDEDFSFQCSDDIDGCAGGLTVDPVYAHD